MIKIDPPETESGDADGLEIIAAGRSLPAIDLIRMITRCKKKQNGDYFLFLPFYLLSNPWRPVIFFFAFMQIKEAAFLIVAEVSPKKILQKCFYFLFSDFQTSRTITTNVFPLRTYFFLVQQHLMTFKNVLEQSKKY